jgi:putative transposase
VTKTHSRHVSNDNPFSEAQFKTLKYYPQFPERFGSIEDGRAFEQMFFAGTTRSMAIPAWGCSPLRSSISIKPRVFATIVVRSSPPPTPNIPSAS